MAIQINPAFINARGLVARGSCTNPMNRIDVPPGAGGGEPLDI
jgi:hypothetical protein